MLLSIPQELIEQLNKGNVVLFCGAGISVSEGGLPSGGQLARELAERAGEPELAKAPLPEVAQAYELKMGHQSLIEYIANRIDDPRYIPLRTHQLIADLPFAKIVTTNWDRLLEKAMDQAGKPFVKVVRDSDVAYADEAKVLLMKLHGSVEQKDSIIITGEDYYDVFARMPETANLVRTYFTTKTILFLGFGLADDDFKRLYYEVVRRIGVHQRRAHAVQLKPDEWTTKHWEKKNVQIIAADATMFLEALADALGMVAEATEPTPSTAPLIPPPPTLYDERLQREIQDQAAGLRQLGVVSQPNDHKMIEVRFTSETLAQYRVYSLCCQKFLDFYEELSEVCDIDTLIGIFDVELHNSYCGDKYDLAVESADLFLQRLINRYSSNADAHEKLIAIRQAILDGADDWDFHSSLIEFRDIGRGLAQDFYREGGRAPNIELMKSKVPLLVFSNLCLSETTSPGFTEPRPISTLPDRIHLPFTNEFKFCHYLSYPFLFFHEYTSHVYVPRIDSRTFDDGWLMYAIELFMQTRWPKLCKRYRLICAQRNVLWKIWLHRFTRLAKKGYEIARDVDMCLKHVGVHQPDVYSPYETGLRQLLNRVRRDHPRYSEALVYQQRLIENITRSRRYGDTDTRKAERAEIIEQLNAFALSALGVSFSELCGLSTSTIGQEPYEHLQGDKDRFLQITWDLASYPSDYAGHLSFHDDFLNLIKRFTQRDRGHLLHSAAEISTSALQLYENLKATSDKF